jgi:hypothetical protein
MGTNYYLQYQNPKTKRCRDYHICKLSYGWVPSFQGYNRDYVYFNMEEDMPNLMSWRQWKLYLMKVLSQGSLIFNEYDEQFTFEEFKEIIEKYMARAKNQNWDNHAQIILNEPQRFHLESSEEDKKNYWIDDEGYSFSLKEFS